MNRILLVFCLLFLVACASRPSAVPNDTPYVLPWGAISYSGLQEGREENGLRDSLKQAMERQLENGATEFSMLALSGGSQKGAFGVGVLKGWQEAGGRPKFTIVTGISTGALTSVFAFLGPDYDETLKYLYTETRANSIYDRRGYIDRIFQDAVFLTEPLKKMIATYVTDSVIDEVGLEYQKGRRLFVGSTDLDNSVLTVWDLGYIASSGNPDKYHRFRQALLASSAMPVLFPPVYFDVEYQGKTYHQMHVDGGVSAPVFSRGLIIDYDRARHILEKKYDFSKIKQDVNVIVNAKLSLNPKAKEVNPDLINIAMASFDQNYSSFSNNSLEVISAYAFGANLNFRVTSIPEEWADPENTVSFDPEYMEMLYQRGREGAINGSVWRQTLLDEGFIKRVVERIESNRHF